MLIMVQGIHSIEEFIGKIWESFPPATYVCHLISNDLMTGFIMINISLFAFGLWCTIFPVRQNHNYANFIIGFWIFIELINGIGHLLWTINQRMYTPGVLTAPILLGLAIILLSNLLYPKNSDSSK